MGIADGYDEEAVISDSTSARLIRQVGEGDQEFLTTLGTKCLIDTKDCSLCFVFPRATTAGGTVDGEQLVEEPMEAAERIFVRPLNPDSGLTPHDGFEALQDGPVSVAVYQEVIRNVLLQLMQRTSLKVSSFESIDQDEVFLRVGLDCNGEVIKELAQRFQYLMPFSDAAYKDMPPLGHFPGHAPMKNESGQPVYHFSPYRMEAAHLFQPFRRVDEIRLIMMRLERWVNLEEMQSQQLLTGYFPAEDVTSRKELHESWSSLSKIFTLPPTSHGGLIHNYFGEEISFFFAWFGFYIRHMVPLAVIGVCIQVADVAPGLDSGTRHKLRLAWAIVLVFWTAGFSRKWQGKETRARQTWGMKDHDARDTELNSYDPNLEGTWWLEIRKMIGNLMVVVYCTLFMLVLVAAEALKTETSKGLVGDAVTVVIKNDGIVLVALVKIGGFAWGKIAPKLVSLQNHRTKASFDSALAFSLFAVKLFIAMWPFVKTAFFQTYTSIECYTSEERLLDAIWGQYKTGAGYPTVAVEGLRQNYLFHKGFNTSQPEVCVMGCFPAMPELETDTDRTNCWLELRDTLSTFYVTGAAMQILFLLIPALLTIITMSLEVRNAKARAAPGEEAKPYSLLQFQAKCLALSPYQYQSWGGSRVEDFLENIIGFALLTSFALVNPLMSLLALVFNCVTYRCYAFRMSHVTCRPMPHGAEGIGYFNSEMNIVAAIAVLVNVCLVVVITWPIHLLPMWQKFAAFITLEHAFILVSLAATFFVSDTTDVDVIERYNIDTAAKLTDYRPLPRPSSESYDYSQVDIGLQPHRRAARDVGATSAPTVSYMGLW
ncbi:unnamed protein product, partial [Polarella glacialis]